LLLIYFSFCMMQSRCGLWFPIWNTHIKIVNDARGCGKALFFNASWCCWPRYVVGASVISSMHIQHYNLHIGHFICWIKENNSSILTTAPLILREVWKQIVITINFRLMTVQYYFPLEASTKEPNKVGRHGRDRMVVRFVTTYANSAYHH
jgi:hypothetical protein